MKDTHKLHIYYSLGCTAVSSKDPSGSFSAVLSSLVVSSCTVVKLLCDCLLPSCPEPRPATYHTQ
jgi:hypothetical protein